MAVNSHQQQQKQQSSSTAGASATEKTLSETSVESTGEDYGTIEESSTATAGVPKEVDVSIADCKSVASSIGLQEASLDDHSVQSLPKQQQQQTKEVTIAAGVADAELDFRKAREILVQRSKANGNEVNVLSKVNLRKAKFEGLEKEARRKSGAFGLLKPSWEETSQDGSAAPPGTFVKTYHEDAPAKKSLEDLP